MYHRQIDVIMSDLAPVMQKYARLLKRIHGRKMRFEDLKISVDPSYEPEISIEESKTYIRGALSVLGEEYMDMVEQAYARRWIDFAQNKGKKQVLIVQVLIYHIHMFYILDWKND